MKSKEIDEKEEKAGAEMSSTAHGTTPYYFVPAPSAYPVLSAAGLLLVSRGACRPSPTP